MNNEVSQRLQAAASQLLQEQPLLLDKIGVATGLAKEQVPGMLNEVVRFLWLVDRSAQSLTPPLILDLAWHELILFTKAYAEFCRRQFGRFIHHSPGGSKSENQAQLRACLKRYGLEFGPPPKQFWGEHGYLSQAADCGACEGNGDAEAASSG